MLVIVVFFFFLISFFIFLFDRFTYHSWLYHFAFYFFFFWSFILSHSRNRNRNGVVFHAFLLASIPFFTSFLFVLSLFRILFFLLIWHCPPELADCILFFFIFFCSGRVLFIFSSFLSFREFLFSVHCCFLCAMSATDGLPAGTLHILWWIFIFTINPRYFVQQISYQLYNSNVRIFG